MKVIQINAIYGQKSTGRTSMELHESMLEQGIEAYVACADSPIQDDRIYLIRRKLFGKIHGLLSRVTGKQAYFSPISTRKLIKFIEKIQPDIVHLRVLHGNFINLKMLLEYLSKNDIAMVITLHDCWFYTGKCCHYTAQGCFKWKTGCYECPRIKKDNKSWFFDRTKKMWNDKKRLFEAIPRLGVVGVSDWITNQARLSFLSSAKILTRIYNWIDLDVFKPLPSEEQKIRLGIQDKFIILGVASDWSNEKGLDKFTDLSGLIQDDMVIVLVGRIKETIKLPQNIIHIQETHNVKELVEYYSMADVFANFSIEETFGKVTAEALSCGTPAIVYNSTATPELVGKDEQCGYVVDIGSNEQILEALGNVKKNGKSHYSDSCIRRASSMFEKDKIIQQYINLYEDLLL